MRKPQNNMPEPENHPLYKAVQHFTEDIRVLLELSAKEPDGTIESFLDLARVELAKTHFPNCSKTEETVYKSLISEVYDHLHALIVSMKGMQEKYRKLATRDLLTGLYNRNHFNEVIVRDIERAKRDHERLSFMLIDVNNFKQINDNWGHLHGDGVLKECASILRRSVRRSDFLCRYGGDEFLIITSKGECEENAPILKRIEQGTAEWNREYAILGYKISFSIGCAVWQEGMDLIDVLHRADQEMYKNKRKLKKK